MEIGRLARAAFPNSSRVKRGKTHVYTGISKKARVDEGGTGVTESEKCAKSDGMLHLTRCFHSNVFPMQEWTGTPLLVS